MKKVFLMYTALFLLLLCSAGAQSAGLKQYQTFSWKPVANARTYEVDVEKKLSDGTWQPEEPELTKETRLEMLLDPGEYRVSIGARNVFNKKSSESPWVSFIILDETEPFLFSDMFAGGSSAAVGSLAAADGGLNERVITVKGKNIFFPETSFALVPLDPDSALVQKGAVVSFAGDRKEVPLAIVSRDREQDAVTVSCDESLLFTGCYLLTVRNPGGLDASVPVNVHTARKAEADLSGFTYDKRYSTAAVEFTRADSLTLAVPCRNCASDTEFSLVPSDAVAYPFSSLADRTAVPLTLASYDPGARGFSLLHFLFDGQQVRTGCYALAMSAPGMTSLSAPLLVIVVPPKAAPQPKITAVKSAYDDGTGTISFTVQGTGIGADARAALVPQYAADDGANTRRSLVVSPAADGFTFTLRTAELAAGTYALVVESGGSQAVCAVTVSKKYDVRMQSLSAAKRDKLFLTPPQDLTVWCYNKGSGDGVKNDCATFGLNPVSAVRVFADADELFDAFEKASAAGTGVPDIVLSENCGRLTDAARNGLFTDLTPRFGAETVSMYQCAVDEGTVDGHLYAVYNDIDPIMFAYRKSLARSYFGTDDPEKIKELFASPDAMIAAAARIKEASRGTCMLTGDTDMLYDVFRAGMRGPVYDGETKKLNPELKKWLQFRTALVGSGYILPLPMWSTEWRNGMNGPVTINGTPTDIFMYVVPSWGVEIYLKQFAKDTAGDWAFVPALYPSCRGGTAYCVPTGSHRKAAVYSVIERLVFFPDDEHVRDMWGSIFSDRQAAGRQTLDSIQKFFGGQDYAAAVRSAAEAMTLQPEGADDQYIKQLLLSGAGSDVEKQFADVEQLLTSQGSVMENLYSVPENWNREFDGSNARPGSTIAVAVDANEKTLSIDAVRGHGAHVWTNVKTSDLLSPGIISAIQGKNAVSLRFKGDGNKWRICLCMKDITAGWGYHRYIFPTKKDEWQTIVIPFSVFTQDRNDATIKWFMPFNGARVNAILFNPEIWDKPEGTEFKLTVSDITFLP